MLNNMAKVLFVIRKTRSALKNSVMYCRITVNGITREFSTGEVIAQPQNWDQVKQLFTGDTSEAAYINALCDTLKYKIKTVCLTVSDTDFLTPDDIILRLKRQNANPLLTTCIEKYIAHATEVLKRAPGTLKHYNAYLRNLLLYQRNALQVSQVTTAWAENFKNWLKTKGKCRHKTRASRHIEFFCMALDHAVAVGEIDKHQLTNYRAERDKRKQLVYLSNSEREKWLTTSIPVKSLSLSQKLFSLQMLTGVSYMDLWATFRVNETQSGKILIATRGKNDTPFFVPFDPKAEEILKEFNYQVPKQDNSTYNKNIKIVAAWLGIEKNISTHTARKTFIMHQKGHGWDMKVLQEMVGHKSIRTTETYYMEASPDRLINEMNRRQK